MLHDASYLLVHLPQLWKITMYHGKRHYFDWAMASIAMSVYQRCPGRAEVIFTCSMHGRTLEGYTTHSGIKRGNWESTRNRGFNRKITY